MSLNVLGIGTDLVEVGRIESMLERHGDTFRNRVYSDQEIRYCSARAAAAQHYAGRWAAKEAVLKVLGTGWTGGLKWSEIEVQNADSGQPLMQLSGKAAEIAAAMGIQHIMISISHTDQYAVAYAVGLGAERGTI